MPPPSIDITNDFLLFPGVEDVVYTRRNPDGASPTTYTGVKALKRVTSSMSDGTFTSKHARWHLQAASLPVTPRRGDRITSVTHGTWEVVSYEVAAYGTRHACECLEVPAS
jgi:hypothetical protein